MDRKIFKPGFWGRGFLWLLLVMFVFTVISRSAAALTTAKVTVCMPSERKLQYTVSVEGKIEKNREISILTQPDILVKSVLVSEGQRVKKGEVLAKLDLQSLDEQIGGIEDEKEMLILQNKTAEKNIKKANKIMVRQMESSLSKYNEIKRRKGKILSPRKGVITSVLVGVGQKTTDTAAFLMADYGAGLKFEGQMAKEDAKYLKAGDSVTIHASEENEEVRVTSLEQDESKEFVNVTAFVSAKKFSIGETVTANSVRESQTYKCTVPVTAVYQSNGKNYILLAKKESTVLGEQEVARKMEIKVLEKNDAYAAIEEGVLSDESSIIADSDRFVEAGDKVRREEG